MHELSIAEELLEIIETRAAGAGIGRVERITLKIGEYSGIMPEALEFAFEVAGQGTVAEGARLEIVEVPVTVRCNACEAETVLEDFAFLCTECGSLDVTVLQGNELYLDSIEVDGDTADEDIGADGDIGGDADIGGNGDTKTGDSRG